MRLFFRRLFMLANLLRPRPGWKVLVRMFRRGATRFPPARPGDLEQIPWPWQWMAGRLLPPDEVDPRRAGWRAVDTTCASTGQPIRVEVKPGVACARCGCHLCDEAAGLEDYFDIPSCWVCRPLVKATR